ncbi:MAG TPA: DMT family transporter [Blastocatellia bacterium]|nr:DMT family transporter [Blastocatellia bacterium]
MAKMPETAPREMRAGFGATDLLLVLMTIIWGSNFTAIKYSIEDLLPLSFNALRFTLASTVMLVIALRSRNGLKVAPGDGKKLLALGLLGNALYQSFFISGMAHTRAGNAALILAITPLFTAILGRIRRHEYFAARGVAGLLLAFAGIVIIVLSGRGEFSIGETILGDCLLLISTVCWSLYTVGSRNLVHAYGSIKATAIMMASGTPLLLLICAPSLLRQDWSRVRPIAWAGLVYSGLFAIAVAYIIWSYGVRKIGSTRTAIYSNITPIVAILVAWPALGESPTLGQLAGAVVIFAGVYLVRHGMIAVAPAAALEEEFEEASLGPGKN